jgi:deoxyribonuclease (pyrimidine dimer)
LSKIPTKFKLGTGHVMFFYDKGPYLRNRYEELKIELTKRGFKYNTESTFDPDGVMVKTPFNHDYVPDEQALFVIRERIQEKIDMKPTWYRKTIYF